MTHRLSIVASVCTALLLAAPAVAQTTVGTLEPISIVAVPGEGGEWVVRDPGATYIRVHFSRFELAAGERVLVSDPDGNDLRVYEGRGPHGTGEFWAFSVTGEAAVIRTQSALGDGSGFEVDSYGRGYAPWPGGSDPVTPESVCGTQDWRDVTCYQASYPTEYEKARGAVKALIGCCSACTAFKVSDSGQYLTNNHCTASTSGVQSTELRFEYQASSCGSAANAYTGSVMGSQMLKTDPTYDYTLFTTSGSSASIPCLELDPRLPPVGERIYIAGHPAGGVKKLSIESDRNAGGLCAVDAAPYPGNGADTDVGYFCDTTNGSSGSPVLSGETHKVVALHHFGGCLNSGGRIDRIYGQISGQLDSCAGGGGGGTCGNGTLDPGEACDGADLNGQTCEGLGFGGGTLACNGSCTGFDTSGCTAACFPSGQTCSTNSQCCSGQCKGGKGGKRCR